MNGTLVASIVLGVLIVGVLAASTYELSSSDSGLSSQNSGMAQQITGLNQQLSNQDGQIAGLNQQIASEDQTIATQNQVISSLGQQVSENGQQVLNQNQVISGLNQQVSTLAQRTETVVTVVQSIITVETSTSVSTSTVTSVSSVPESALIVTGDSYNNATGTFTFQVQNTQSYVIYAQLSATLWGQGNLFCNGQAGAFISQVYTFAPSSPTTAQLNLSLGTYAGFCGSNPVTSLDLTLIVPQSTAVSPTYSFTIAPGFESP